MDWFASDLPREGKSTAQVGVGDLAQRDAPTCGPRELIADVARRVRADGWDLCVVVDSDRVVLGMLDAEALGGAGLVENAMREAPTTFRPHAPVDKAAERFKRRDGQSLLITTSSGHLIGVLRRARVEPRPERSPSEAATR